MNLFLAIVVVTMVARECSSSGLESLINGEFENFENQKEINSHLEDEHSSSTTAQVIPDIQHYISSLDQQSVLADLAELPVTDRININSASKQIVKIFGSNHPMSMTLLHVQWLLKNSPELQHSFDRHNESNDDDDDEEESETELQVRDFGFDLTTSHEENQFEGKQPIRENQSTQTKTILKRKPMNYRRSLFKKSKSQGMNSMTV